MSINYLLFLQEIREKASPVLNNFMYATSDFAVGLGHYLFVMFILYVVDKKIGRRICAAYGLNMLVSMYAKNIACISRPWVKDARVIPPENMKATAGGFSFPSGHSAIGVSVFYPVVMFVKNKIWKVLSIILILLIMFSRNYAGVHTIEDVLVGAILAVIGCYVASKIMDFIEKNEINNKKVKNLDIIVFLIGTILYIIGVVFVYTKKFPTNATAEEISSGVKSMVQAAFVIVPIFLSIILEGRFIKYTTNVSIMTKIIRFIVGVIVLQIYLNVVPSFLKSNFGSLVAGIFKYSVTWFVMCFVIPLIFNIYEKCFKLK